MPPKFRNVRNLTEAVAALTDNPSWQPVCGGTDVLVQLQGGRLKSDGFVNLWGVLPRKIHEQDGAIHIGAGVNCTQLENSALVRERLPALWQAARTMGSPQIRNRATLGGNIGNASPAADMAAALMVDDAHVTIQMRSAQLAVPLRNVFVGPGKTSLKPGALITEIMIPKPPAYSYCRFDKLGFRQAQVIAAINFSIRAVLSDDCVQSIRITWGSVAPTPVVSATVEGLLLGARLSDHMIESAAEAVAADISPIDDHRASAAYRLAVARSFLRRALKELRRGR